MGLFCTDLIERLDLPHVQGRCSTSDQLFYNIFGREFLEEEETERLHSLYQNNLTGSGLISLVGTLMEKDIQVCISDAIQELKQRDSDCPINPYRTEDGRVLILGEYIKNKKQIKLYINNIRAVAQENEIMSPSFLLQAVLIHELYHVFFDKDKYIQELEEPMAEFGSLLYMRLLNDGGRGCECKITALFQMIKGKKHNAWLKYYSVGAYLFQNLCIDNNTSELLNLFKDLDLTRVKPGPGRKQKFALFKKSPSANNLIAVIR